MKTFILTAAFVLVTMTQSSSAQEDGDKPKRADQPRKSPIDRIMALDKNDDGVIQKSEAEGERIERMFDRADADDDGQLSRAEIEKVFGGRGRFRGRGPGGVGRPGGDRPRFPGGDRPGISGGERPRFPGPDRPGFAGPPKPGTVLPGFLQTALKLSDDQKDQLAKLQAHVDAQLSEILTSEQQERLKTGKGLRPGRDGGPRERGDRGERRERGPRGERPPQER